MDDQDALLRRYEELSRLTERRNDLDHAILYLNKAGEYELAAKAGRSVYLVNQQINKLKGS